MENDLDLVTHQLEDMKFEEQKVEKVKNFKFYINLSKLMKKMLNLF